MKYRKWGLGFAVVLALLVMPTLLFAQEEAPLPKQVSDLATHLNWLWTCIAAFLVFFMQAGFAFVEAGFTRAKNVVNIMMKNLMDFAIGSIGFWAIGFGLMFSGGVYEFFVNPDVNAYGEAANWMYSFLIFQTVFCATAATIVSGAMAERTKFGTYLIFSAAMSIFIYPISGSWAWGGLWHGGGWLENLGFVDFAGSSVVHSVGGWAALAGAIVLGPRRGKFNADGSANPIVGHNMGMATLGVFILWLGWFGFNPGSTTSMDGGNFARVAVTTNLAAAAGAILSLIASWMKFGKADISMTLNGALAGLVAITAGCYIMTPMGAILTGAIAGVLVVFAVLFFEKIRIDDPVGAISVHGVCGAWGTLACAIPFFCRPDEAGSFVTQLIGIAAIFAYAFTVSLIVFYLLKVTIGIRVSDAEEDEGLDVGEHGVSGYANFMMTHER